MIIDDDQVYLRFMKSHFEKMGGYKVSVYSDPDLAVNDLTGNSPYLVIMDHNLSHPTYVGLDFVKKIKKLVASPIFYITSDNTSKVQQEALKAGARSVIIKSESFLVKLRTAIDEYEESKKKGFLSKIFR